MGDHVRKQKPKRYRPKNIGQFYCESLSEQKCKENQHGAETSFCKWIPFSSMPSNWKYAHSGTLGNKNRAGSSFQLRHPGFDSGWKYHQPFGWAGNMIMFSSDFKEKTRGLKDYLFAK